TLMLVLQPNKPPYPPDSSVEWYKDGVLIPNSANDTLLVTASGVYKAVFNDKTCNEFTYEGDTVWYSFIYCGGVGMNENSKTDIRLYPNPARDVLEIQVPFQLQDSVYTITSMLGKTMATGVIENIATAVNIAGIAPGVYILHLQNQAVKFVKE
ncbi:MAG TPA: T9SS type A sorting domain-containing protein, partial [Bacteroidia bacterium]|nr:T9SS type A sorting domain-containing protein [Bacteroidia bacterium]